MATYPLDPSLEAIFSETAALLARLDDALVAARQQINASRQQMEQSRAVIAMCPAPLSLGTPPPASCSAPSISAPASPRVAAPLPLTAPGPAPHLRLSGDLLDQPN